MGLVLYTMGALFTNNSDKKWNWSRMYQNNPNITWEIISTLILDMPWNWEYVYQINQNITWEIIQANPDKSVELDIFIK